MTWLSPSHLDTKTDFAMVIISHISLVTTAPVPARLAANPDSTWWLCHGGSGRAGSVRGSVAFSCQQHETSCGDAPALVAFFAPILPAIVGFRG